MKELQEAIKEAKNIENDIDIACRGESGWGMQGGSEKSKQALSLLISTAQDYAKLQLELEEVKMCYERGKHYDKR